jgi:predicted nucleic acid-binding protein
VTTAPAKRSAAPAAVLVDTGVLVAAFDRLDAQHLAATRWLAEHAGPMLTVASVLTETSFFLPPRLRAALADLVAREVLKVRLPDAAGYARIGQLFGKYADQDPDWADLELVWLAESTGINRIATLDVADFTVYRIHGRKRFELEMLR